MVLILFLAFVAGVCQLPTSVAAFQSNALVCLWHRCLQPPLCVRIYRRLPKGLAPTSHFTITGKENELYIICLSLFCNIFGVSATHVFIPTPIAKSNSRWRIVVVSAPMPRYPHILTDLWHLSKIYSCNFLIKKSQ